MAKKVVAEKKTVLTKKLAKKMNPLPRSTAKFVSFSFGATIPTQSFGNVTPRIEVTAASYEDARDFAIPRIEELYAKFAEVKPVYMGRITEETKIVVAVPKEKEVESSPSSTEVSAPPTSPMAPTKSKSDAVLKAEKAIGLAMTYDAAVAIQEQIERSTKIAAEDKPALYDLVLKKRSELKNK